MLPPCHHLRVLWIDCPRALLDGRELFSLYRIVMRSALGALGMHKADTR